MQHPEEPKRKGRRPANELAEKRERDIAEAAVAAAKWQKRLEELEEAKRKANKSARRAYLNQQKFAVGGLAQIAGLLEADAGFVLGVMLAAAEHRERDGTWPAAMFHQHKARGDAVLAERVVARKGRKRSVDDDEDIGVGAVAIPKQASRDQETGRSMVATVT
jgi:hypothetical protein